MSLGLVCHVKLENTEPNMVFLNQKFGVFVEKHFEVGLTTVDTITYSTLLNNVVVNIGKVFRSIKWREVSTRYF